MKYTRLKSEHDLRNDLNKRVDFYNSASEAWGEIRVLNKKDGSHFADIRRNFNDLTIISRFGTEQLVISFHTKLSGYAEDFIRIDHDIVEEITVEEVTKLIAERIKQLNEYVESYNKLIDQSEKVLAKLEEMEKEELNYIESIEKETGIKCLEYKFGALGYKD